MPRNSSRRRLLGLEPLETRTLLAGDGDPFGLVADFAATQKALSGTGDFTASFSTNFGNHQLVLTGTSSSVVTIDLTTLPDFITNVRIDSFSTVNFVGTDHVENLILTNVGTVNGANLTVTETVHADHVGSLTLGGLGNTAVLSGDAMNFNVASLGADTMIISDLNKLTLGSTSKSLYVLSLNDSQILNLTYTPEVVAVSGMPTSSVHILLPGTQTGGSSTGPGPGSGTINPPAGGGPIVGTGDGTINIGGGDSNSNSNSGGVVVPPLTPTDTPESNHVVVVSLPADERTRAFISELRGLLHTTDGDSHQQVLDLVNHSAPNTNLSGLMAQRISLPATTSPATMRIEVDGRLVELQGSMLNEISPPTAIENAPVIVERGFDSELFVDRPLNLAATTNVVTETVMAANVDVAFTAPVVAAPAPTTDVARARTESGSHQNETRTELGATVMALGTYLVERVSAEFSPGQQSIVLLVDPKSSRSSHNQRSLSAIDIFAQGGDDVRVI